MAELVVQLGRLALWRTIPMDVARRRFSASIAGRGDREIAETYFNSAIRRLYGTVGVDEESEFLDLSPADLPADRGVASARFEDPDGLVLVLGRALRSLGLSRWRDLDDDARRIAARLEAELPLDGGGELSWLPAAFLRSRRAFLVGRLATAAGARPIIVATVAGDDGLRADAVLTTADAASIVFSFTRSHFQVDLEEPRAAVGFLGTLMPSKRIDEIYSVIGYHRHGKREFYQALHRTIADPDVRFEPIEGIPGMVMVAFVLKPLNAIFKLIKDRCDPPKQITRREVMAKYQLVFLKEHGGRLADTQEFTGLALPKRSFAETVTRDLLAHARDTVKDAGDRWHFSHLYTERRMTPLDVFLRTAAPDNARAAVVDFGRAIKELAAVNLFPGDMLPKNFGVTRHGRVVFYDYDEICPLTDCRFRTIPEARSYDEEVAGEPWYTVAEGDVFPEEWERFLRFREPLHELFRHYHRDLFTAGFWNAIRDRVAAREIVEPAPYGPESRLRNGE